MDHIPAQCLNPNCRLVFPSPIAVGAGFVQSCGTNCPRCGENAAIANGQSIWDPVANKPVFYPFDQFSTETVSVMQHIISQYRSGALSREQALQTADSYSPKHAAALRWAIDYDKLGILIALLMAIYTILHDRSDGEAQERVIEIMQQQHYEQAETLEVLKKMKLDLAELKTEPNAHRSADLDSSNRKERRAKAAQDRQRHSRH